MSERFETSRQIAENLEPTLFDPAEYEEDVQFVIEQINNLVENETLTQKEGIDALTDYLKGYYG